MHHRNTNTQVESNNSGTDPTNTSVQQLLFKQLETQYSLKDYGLNEMILSNLDVNGLVSLYEIIREQSELIHKVEDRYDDQIIKLMESKHALKEKIRQQYNDKLKQSIKVPIYEAISQCQHLPSGDTRNNASINTNTKSQNYHINSKTLN